MPRTVKMLLRLDPDLHRALRQRAHQDHEYASAVVRRALRRDLGLPPDDPVPKLTRDGRAIRPIDVGYLAPVEDA